MQTSNPIKILLQDVIVSVGEGGESPENGGRQGREGEEEEESNVGKKVEEIRHCESFCFTLCAFLMSLGSFQFHLAGFKSRPRCLYGGWARYHRLLPPESGTPELQSP